jgi:hypothetical protein
MLEDGHIEEVHRQEKHTNHHEPTADIIILHFHWSSPHFCTIEITGLSVQFFSHHSSYQVFSARL